MSTTKTDGVHSVELYIQISADEFQRYYRGSAKNVRAYDNLGRRVVFPANILQPFVTREGINGSFRIIFDQNGKFLQAIRLDSSR